MKSSKVVKWIGIIALCIVAYSLAWSVFQPPLGMVTNRSAECYVVAFGLATIFSAFVLWLAFRSEEL